MVKHTERCKKCKERVYELLCASFGEVKRNHDLHLPAHLEDYSSSPHFKPLKRIYKALRVSRGHHNFVHRNKLSRADFFVVNPGFIVEFDETQHFTKPREISLKNYPVNLCLGFNKTKWRNLCISLDKKDNDPTFRDEQRAWYDTLRDFTPKLLGFGQTIRLYSRDLVWCSLNPRNKSDLANFKQIIMKGKAVNDN